MPINMDIIENRLYQLRYEEYVSKPKKKTKPEVYTQSQIQEEIFFNDALYFDIHREHSQEFSDLMINGWPENLSKENLKLQKIYIRRRVYDMDRYVIKN